MNDSTETRDAASAVEPVDGVTRVTEHDNESWDAWGAPSGEALTRAAAKAVDGLAGRLREAMGIA